LCRYARLQRFQQGHLPGLRRGHFRLFEGFPDRRRQLSGLLIAGGAELVKGLLDGGVGGLPQCTLLITAQHPSGQSPAGRIGEQSDQPRPKVIHDEWHTSSLLLLWHAVQPRTQMK
jgi:hypothetical protein